MSVRRSTARIEHLLATDPDGCWVAERAGAVVGATIAIVREGVWGLSMLGVDPAEHGGGLGRALLGPALAYGSDCRAGIILSSTHPGAMRSYARAGFRLLPCVTLSGAWDPRAVPAGLRARPGDVEADAATIDEASRHVRSASHREDLPTLLGTEGATLHVLEGEGYVVGRDGSPALLAATTEDAARDLLWSCFTAGPRGGTVHVDFITAGNDWAIEVGLAAGLALSPEGPVFVRGELGPLAPFLPSGAYL